MAATATQTQPDMSAITEGLNRASINDSGDDNRVGPDGEAAPRTDEEFAQSQLTLRAIVTSKEAGVIIGKAGKNVADLRDETGVKAGVSKVVPGVHDRVLTVTGALEAISKAYSIVAKGLLEGAPQMGMGGLISSNGTHREYPYFEPTQGICPSNCTPHTIPDGVSRVFRALTVDQPSVCLSPIIRWARSLADKASRSNISKTYQASVWWLKRKCYLNLPNAW